MKILQNCVAVLGAALLCVVAPVSTGHASTVIGGPQEGITGYYDYTPHGIRANGYEWEFWCGDNAAHTNDTIFEQRYLLSNWSVATPQQVAFQEGATGSWDDTYTCNPSNPVQGSFPNVLGDGITYNYVIYYVGYSNATKINQIGAAFSVDGLIWKKYPLPVEAYPNPSCGGCYGYAQPNVLETGTGLMLFYEDNPGGSLPVSHRQAVSTDGVHFTELSTLSNAGLATPVPNWGSLAYNPSDMHYYTLVGDGWRPSSTTGNIQEDADNGCTLYSTTDPLAGTWTELDTIDTNLTGYEANFLCGFVTDFNGDLSPDLLPSMKILTSTSFPRPSYNASRTDLGNSAGFNNWQIDWNTYTPGNVWHPLQRLDYPGGHHEITTGWYDGSVYHLENVNLGKLAEAPTGAATVPLYGCKSTNVNYFVSLQADCEGQYKLGLEGYFYNTPASDRIALYRCRVPGVDHFVSTDPNCEGQTTDFLIGYSQS
jgi:hypothetical protein